MMLNGKMILSEDSIHINDIPTNQYIKAEVVIPCSGREIAVLAKKFIINLQKLADKLQERQNWLAQWLKDNEKHDAVIHSTYLVYLDEFNQIRDMIEVLNNG